MSNVAKLKKQAAEFEQKKQFDKALAVYVRLLDSFDEYADELDVALFNRVGDLMLRQGNVVEALDYYENAVTRYSDTGFFNNAIALCNKILRHSPGRASIYYKLGKISAQKGFKNDAKVNFLEYADRMQKAGRVDEAFRALKEFADLCPDQHEIRLMLADQLLKLDRKAEAVEQLQTLYSRYESEERSSDALAIADRIRELDATVALKMDGGGPALRKSSDLVFLDLDAPPATQSPARGTVIPSSASTPASPVGPPRILTPATAALDAPLSGITRIDDDAANIERTPSQSVAGLESTQLAGDDLMRNTPTSSLLGLEPTSLNDSPPVHRSGAPTKSRQDESTPVGDLEFEMPPSQPTAARGSANPSIDFDTDALLTPLRGAPLVPPRAVPGTPHGALEGLPLMDLDVPITPTPAAPKPRGANALDNMTLSRDLELIMPERDEPEADAAQTVNDLNYLDLNDESLTADDVPAVRTPTPPNARRSTLVAMQSVEALKSSVESEPANWGLHRALAEAMFEAGERADGIRELESAMIGAERVGDLDLASALAEELSKLEPEVVKHHQKRVEYAFRTNDRPRLIEAYLSLGDTLLRSEQGDKARTVYQRVIDLAPNDARAKAAIESLVVPPVEPPAAASPSSRHAAPVAPTPAAQPSSTTRASEFVNLGDWLRDDSGPKDTRMVVAEQEPTGDEEADFADMLRKFKQGVAENVDAEDYQSHYDLAIAFKEMGLLNEAIAEFQKALGSPVNRLPTYEALGQCFLEKGQPKLAMSVLTRALNEPSDDDQLVGVLYWLGRAAAELGLAADALSYYQRVFVIDIQFRDIAERMIEVERAAR